MLSSNDIQLLQLLQSDPLKSYAALSESLGKAAQTVKKYYEQLEERFPNSFAVIGDINFLSIDLVLVDVFISLASIAHISLVQNALANHEYIRYTSRCLGLGPNSGVFAQFTIPQGTEEKLKEFLNVFIERNYAESFELYKHTNRNFIKLPELDSWIPEEHRWSFSEKQILDKLAEISDQPRFLSLPLFEKFDLTQMDKTKLIILEELSFDARRSDRQIFRERSELDKKSQNNRCSLKLDVSFSTFSRAMNVIDPYRTELQGYDNLRKTSRHKGLSLINGYRLHYSPKIFSIFDTVIFKGKISYDWKLNQLYNLIYDGHPFKFRMNFSIYENNDFAWYIPIPSQYLNAYIDGITKYITKDFQVIWINYGSTIQYQFWPENFDLETKTWKTTDDWMTKGPLIALDELEKKFV